MSPLQGNGTFGNSGNADELQIHCKGPWFGSNVGFPWTPVGQAEEARQVSQAPTTSTESLHGHGADPSALGHVGDFEGEERTGLEQNQTQTGLRRGVSFSSSESTTPEGYRVPGSGLHTGEPGGPAGATAPPPKSSAWGRGGRQGGDTMRAEGAAELRAQVPTPASGVRNASWKR